MFYLWLCTGSSLSEREINFTKRLKKKKNCYQNTITQKSTSTEKRKFRSPSIFKHYFRVVNAEPKRNYLVICSLAKFLPESYLMFKGPPQRTNIKAKFTFNFLFVRSLETAKYKLPEYRGRENIYCHLLRKC